MWNSSLAMFFERHLRWIRSDVLSIRRAEKKWMAGRLPVKSLCVSTSSLACFCHKLLFGLDLICPATLCTALCRPSSNIRLRMLAETALSFRGHATWDTGGGCVFCELYQSSPRAALRINTSIGVLFHHNNLSCLVAVSLHASTASKRLWHYNLELNSLL